MDAPTAFPGRLAFAALCMLAVTGVMLVARDVVSRPRDPGTLLERVAALEEEVGALRGRLAELERVTVGKVTDRSPTQHVVAFPTTPEEDELSDCGEPFTIDEVGTKVLKSACAKEFQGPSCDPLWTIDRTGTRTIRPGCESRFANSCTVPFIVDPWGRQVARPGCVDVGY
jgi:hypothetical protein